MSMRRVITGVAAIAALAGNVWAQEVDQEPERPSPALLETVQPMGLRISVGDLRWDTNDATGMPEWQVPVACGAAAGEQERLASPMPGDRWLFGVLWGDDVAEPRSYIQAIPKVTLWLTQPETGRSWPAAWGRFYRCPMSTEHLALPLWPEDASALADGAVLVEVDVEALGMPRSRDMREVLDARSIEDAARRLLWLAFNFDEMAVPVDGLVNGGPVFEVREVVPY